MTYVEDQARGHTFARDMLKGMPVLRCTKCGDIWWPYRTRPFRVCPKSA